MAKKKAAAKKTGNKPSKKSSAPAKRNNSGKSKATRSSKPESAKTIARSVVKTNGVSQSSKKKTTPLKSSGKKIAGGAGQAAHQNIKQRNNGTPDDQGLNPQTYQMLRQDIISTLWKYDEITFDELCAAMEKIHGKNFVNDSLKYIRQVVNDLTNIDLIEQIDRDASRRIYRIRQRLSE